MINEFEEFRAYTKFPEYKAASPKDVAFLGRFTMPMLLDNYGFDRIFTILARHYLYENCTVPYDNTDYARRALCAWCSTPSTEKIPVDKPGRKVNFKEYHNEFPYLVDENGAGWYYRHVQNVIKTIKDNSDTVSSPNRKNGEILEKSFLKNWESCVRQYAIPAYSKGIKREWMTFFDDCIADALELGPLTNKEIELTEKTIAFLKAKTPKGVPETVLPELLKYYFANKPDDSDWVILPEQNFSAYFGNASFQKKWLSKLPKDVIERKYVSGVCKYKMNMK